MMKPFKFIKNVLNLKNTIMHPVQKTRDGVKSYIIEKTVEMILSNIQKISPEASQKIQDMGQDLNEKLEKKFIFEMSPSQIKILNTDILGFLKDKELLEDTSDMLNELLGAPLGLLGYNLGAVFMTYDSETNNITTVLHCSIKNSNELEAIKKNSLIKIK